jgi:hypothetical protein
MCIRIVLGYLGNSPYFVALQRIIIRSPQNRPKVICCFDAEELPGYRDSLQRTVRGSSALLTEDSYEAIV